MDYCSAKHEISGDSGRDGSFVKTTIHRPSLSITHIKPGSSTGSGSGRKSFRRRIRPGSRHFPSFPSLKPRCPPSVTRQASSICFPILSSRTVKQSLTARPGEFVLANFDARNIETFCEQSSRYRSCLEALYSNDDSCLPNLKEDAFYSFIVAFEDKFCEKNKQIEWLINSGCLKETIEHLPVKRCLLRSGVGEDRTLCKTMTQMTDCVMDSIITNCRVSEVKFFEKIYDGLHVRSSYCTPSEGPRLGRFSISVGNNHGNNGNDEAVEDYENEEEKTAIFSTECPRSRQIALIREESYVPECKETGTFLPLQCDRYNGSCFCVDELTGIPFEGTSSGPGNPLPLCGLKSLFTCEKLPSKIFCEVDGTIAQKTERWYRRGDRCIMYLYDYCGHQSHLPPIPLRTKTDCERFCLPATR